MQMILNMLHSPLLMYCASFFVTIFLHIYFVLSAQLNDAVQPIDSPLKSLLYSMLSTEGSYKSQKVLYSGKVIVYTE